MRSMVDIEVLIDKDRVDPLVKILTREKNEQVENIIDAIENVTENDFPRIPATGDEGIEFVSQREIIRVYTEGRKIFLQTEEAVFVCRKTISALEEELNPSRFIRISQSEIVNVYKVKRFDINMAGTIGVEFENGMKSWASRSCVKGIKKMLKA